MLLELQMTGEVSDEDWLFKELHALNQSALSHSHPRQLRSLIQGYASGFYANFLGRASCANEPATADGGRLMREIQASRPGVQLATVTILSNINSALTRNSAVVRAMVSSTTVDDIICRAAQSPWLRRHFDYLSWLQYALAIYKLNENIIHRLALWPVMCESSSGSPGDQVFAVAPSATYIDYRATRTRTR